MNEAVFVRLRNQLTVVKGGIELGNLELVNQGIRRMEAELATVPPPLLNGKMVVLSVQ